jgi:hypothetical protein
MIDKVIKYNVDQSQIIDYYIRVKNIISHINKMNIGMATTDIKILKRNLETHLIELKVDPTHY